MKIKEIKRKILKNEKTLGFNKGDYLYHPIPHII